MKMMGLSAACSLLSARPRFVDYRKASHFTVLPFVKQAAQQIFGMINNVCSRSPKCCSSIVPERHDPRIVEIMW
jgi:hypothetical protein